MVLGQVVSVLLNWGARELGVLPQIRCEIGVGLGNGLVGGLGEVAQRSGTSRCRSVAILNTCHFQELLGHWGRDDPSSTWCRNETHQNGTTFARDLAWNGVGFSDLVPPVSSSNWNDGQFGQDNSSTNCSGYFLGALDSKTDVSVEVANGNESLETSSLTSPSLLLDRHDLQHLVLEGLTQEMIDDLKLLDWQRKQVDLLQGFDLSITDQTSQLGYRDPFFV